LVERFFGTVGVVGTDAWVGPPLGASWTPGAFELPHAARRAAQAQIRSARLGIERGRLADAI
jgi:hypothetical protein